MIGNDIVKTEYFCFIDRITSISTTKKFQVWVEHNILISEIFIATNVDECWPFLVSSKIQIQYLWQNKSLYFSSKVSFCNKPWSLPQTQNAIISNCLFIGHAISRIPSMVFLYIYFWNLIRSRNNFKFQMLHICSRQTWYSPLIDTVSI